MITKPNILILEDDKGVVKVLKESYPHYLFTHAENLFDFHGFTFDAPGVEQFSLVIMDLQLDMDEFPLSIMRESFPAMFSKPITRLDNQAPLYGWDYYTRIICSDDRTIRFADDKFILLSGCTQFLKDRGYLDKDEYKKIIIVDKGIDETQKILRDRLSSLKL